MDQRFDRGSSSSAWSRGHLGVIRWRIFDRHPGEILVGVVPERQHDPRQGPVATEVVPPHERRQRIEPCECRKCPVVEDRAESHRPPAGGSPAPDSPGGPPRSCGEHARPPAQLDPVLLGQLLGHERLLPLAARPFTEIVRADSTPSPSAPIRACLLRTCRSDVIQRRPIPGVAVDAEAPLDPVTGHVDRSERGQDGVILLGRVHPDLDPLDRTVAPSPEVIEPFPVPRGDVARNVPGAQQGRRSPRPYIARRSSSHFVSFMTGYIGEVQCWQREQGSAPTMKPALRRVITHAVLS